MGTSQLEEEIGHLAGLDQDKLRRLWVEHHEVPTPRHLSRQVMINAIAYSLTDGDRNAYRLATVD